MEKMDFYVYLSPKEAAEKVKEAVTAGLYSGEILDEYVRILPNGGAHEGASFCRRWRSRGDFPI